MAVAVGNNSRDMEAVDQDHRHNGCEGRDTLPVAHSHGQEEERYSSLDHMRDHGADRPDVSDVAEAFGSAAEWGNFG